ncbi:MAG TPA: AraC family transcriptional regulator [Bryobacteraceae bacterium]|nr:AraC family transcriptional regulator [Bryobacteraceae bacterium]
MASRIHRAKLYRPVVAGVAPMRFVSDHHFPRHSHDQFGVGVIASGGQRSWSGVGTVRALTGDVIMVNPGEIHDGAPLDGAAREWRIVYLDPAVVACEVEEEFSGPVEIVRPVASDPLLAWHVTELFNSLIAQRSDSLDREEKLLRSVVWLFRKHGTAKFIAGGTSPSVTRAVKRINSGLEKPVSLAELAGLAGVSRFQLLRAFSRELGITPHAYLIQRRVLLAQRLLADGETPAAAAIRAGFSDQSHMTRAFVRQVGVTPGCYRAAVA